MPRVLVPLADGFEEIEAVTVTDILRRANVEVTLAGLRPGQVISTRSVSIIPDITIDMVRPDEFDMLVLPGGQPGTDNLKADKRVLNLVREFNSKRKTVAAICAAPLVLLEAGILTRKRMTCYPSLKDKFKDAVYEEKDVVTEGNIVTSKGPGTAHHFSFALLERLRGRHVVDEVKSAMLLNVAEVPQHKPEIIWDPHQINNVIQSLVSGTELNDKYLQGHTKRVTEYSLAIGKKMGLPVQELRDLYFGAILHDIGKVATEAELLNKPETLNQREEIIIREHPLKGALFIAGLFNLTHIIPTIIHHHERWDGSGYPGKLHGDQIPLHARIVCVVDAYDAMTSPRSYRPALERDIAVNEISGLKGIQFDPQIVDLFIECLNDNPHEFKDFSYYF